MTLTALLCSVLMTPLCDIRKVEIVVKDGVLYDSADMTASGASWPQTGIHTLSYRLGVSWEHIGQHPQHQSLGPLFGVMRCPPDSRYVTRFHPLPGFRNSRVVLSEFVPYAVNCVVGTQIEH